MDGEKDGGAAGARRARRRRQGPPRRLALHVLLVPGRRPTTRGTASIEQSSGAKRGRRARPARRRGPWRASRRGRRKKDDAAPRGRPRTGASAWPVRPPATPPPTPRRAASARRPSSKRPPGHDRHPRTRRRAKPGDALSARGALWGTTSGLLRRRRARPVGGGRAAAAPGTPRASASGGRLGGARRDRGAFAGPGLAASRAAHTLAAAAGASARTSAPWGRDAADVVRAAGLALRGTWQTSCGRSGRRPAPRRLRGEGHAERGRRICSPCSPRARSPGKGSSGAQPRLRVVVDLFGFRADLRRYAAGGWRLADARAREVARDALAVAAGIGPPPRARASAYALVREGRHAGPSGARQGTRGPASRAASAGPAHPGRGPRPRRRRVDEGGARAPPDREEAHRGGRHETAPSIRFVLVWETDATTSTST